MEKEIFYKVGEDIKIDKLFKETRKRLVVRDELLAAYKEASHEADEAWASIRKAIEKLKNITLPGGIGHDNAEGTIHKVLAEKD